MGPGEWIKSGRRRTAQWQSVIKPSICRALFASLNLISASFEQRRTPRTSRSSSQSVNYVRLEDFSPPAAPRDVLAKRTARKARGASGAAGFDDTAAGGAGGEGAAGAGAGEAGERVTIDMSGEAEEGGGPE